MSARTWKDLRNGKLVRTKDGSKYLLLDGYINRLTRWAQLGGSGRTRISSHHITHVGMLVEYEDGSFGNEWAPVTLSPAQERRRRNESAAEWACNPASETYWSM